MFTDAWHPTINASSRMPVFYQRYAQYFGDTFAILNEVPRPYGGSTIRVMRTDSERQLTIRKVISGPKWMPWWAPASSEQAQTTMDTILSARSKILHGSEVKQERRLLSEFKKRSSTLNTTMAEALNTSNEHLYRKIIPSIPRIKIKSLRNSSIRHKMAESLVMLELFLPELLSKILHAHQKVQFGLLAILINDNDGDAFRVRFDGRSNKFTGTSIMNPQRLIPLTVSAMAKALDAGNLLPASTLSLIMECAIACDNTKVFHFGNTYGKIPIVLKSAGWEKKRKHISYLKDDQDSWNFAVLNDRGERTYPLHLLDVMKLGNTKYAPNDEVEEIFWRSIASGGPISIPVSTQGWVDDLFN